MLKYQVDTLDRVDEAHKPFYKEAQGGGFVLQVEGAVAQSRFDELNQKAVDNATEAARRRKTVERITQTLGVDNADGIDTVLADLLAKAKGGSKSSEQQEQIIAQIKAEAASSVDAANKKLRAFQMEAAKAQFEAQLLGAGFPEKAAGMFAAANMARLSIDDDGKLRVLTESGTPKAGSGADGFATMADLAKELAAAMPEFLVDKGKGGGGKPPASGSGNPGQKTITRSAFDAMSHFDRAEFSKSGGKVTDG